MSRRSSSEALKIQQHADIFAALGDPVRLTLVAKLVGGKPHSISELTEGTKITRQAVTKHLRVLEDVGVVESAKNGRENLYELNTKPFESLQIYLDVIAKQWDQSLQNLKAFVETE
ncbi:MAG: metalloregulator ArsR/SmtB family transcription factor [Bdellovibrionota bacterium]